MFQNSQPDCLASDVEELPPEKTIQPQPQLSTSASISSIGGPPLMGPPKKQRKLGPVAKQNQLLTLACKYLSKSDNANEDLLDISKVWANKLKAIDPRQRLFAEKAINDILFEAQLGNLSKDSVKINEHYQVGVTQSNSYFSPSPGSTSVLSPVSTGNSSSLSYHELLPVTSEVGPTECSNNQTSGEESDVGSLFSSFRANY